MASFSFFSGFLFLFFFVFTSSKPLQSSELTTTYTVSGLSSGAYFAVQHGVSWSSEVTGLGVFAGGPFYCAKGKELTALTACMSAPSEINLNTLYDDTTNYVKNGDIDDTSNIKDMMVYFFSGTLDTEVATGCVQAGVDYFQNYVANKSQVYFNTDIHSEHAMVTNDYGNECWQFKEPYINNCDFDGVGDMLKWIFPEKKLNDPLKLNDVPYNENLVALDQKDYTPNGVKPSDISMENTGYVYVPTNCTIMPLSNNCILHVAYHGCKQDLSTITLTGVYNDTYVHYSGYNQWGETNNIVVLYPQASKDDSAGNPEGCWDWWGYLKNDDNYAVQSGVQMATVHNMLTAVING